MPTFDECLEILGENDSCYRLKNWNEFGIFILDTKLTTGQLDLINDSLDVILTAIERHANNNPKNACIIHRILNLVGNDQSTLAGFYRELDLITDDMDPAPDRLIRQNCLRLESLVYKNQPLTSWLRGIQGGDLVAELSQARELVRSVCRSVATALLEKYGNETEFQAQALRSEIRNQSVTPDASWRPAAEPSTNSPYVSAYAKWQGMTDALLNPSVMPSAAPAARTQHFQNLAAQDYKGFLNQCFQLDFLVSRHCQRFIAHVTQAFLSDASPVIQLNRHLLQQYIVCLMTYQCASMDIIQLEERLELRPENGIRLLDFMYGDTCINPLSRFSDKIHALEQLKGLGTSDLQLRNKLALMMPDGSRLAQLSQMLEKFHLHKAKLADYISIRLDLQLECINDWAELEKMLDNIDAYAFGCLVAFYKASKLLHETKRPNIQAFLKNPKCILQFDELKINLESSKLHTRVSNRLFCQELAVYFVADMFDILERACRRHRQADYPWVKSAHIVQKFTKSWWYERTGIDQIASTEPTIDQEGINFGKLWQSFAAHKQQYQLKQQRTNATSSTSTTSTPNNNSTASTMRPNNSSSSSK